MNRKNTDRLTDKWDQLRRVQKPIGVRMRGVLPFGFLGWDFGKGADKVVQIKNNYDKEVFNGDIGRIARIDSEP